MALLFSGEDVSEQNVMFHEFAMNFLASTWVFRTKSNLISDLSIFNVIFVDVRHILKIKGPLTLPLTNRQTYIFILFLANGFHDFENNCTRKKTKVFINFALFLFFGQHVTYSDY